MRRSLMYKCAVLFSLGLGSAQPNAVWAQTAEVPPLTKVSNLLSGMGYEPQVANDHLVTREGNYVINYFISNDGSTLYIYEQYNVTPAQSEKAPLLKLLTYNDTHAVYFSVSVGNNGAVTGVTINQTTSARALSPAILRSLIDSIKKTDTDQQALFNPANWK